MSRSSSSDSGPDCEGALSDIQLFGRGDTNPLSGAATDIAVVYDTEAGASRSAFLGMFAQTGKVRARMCGSCRRIFLFGADIE